MSSPSAVADTPVETRAELVEHIASGSRPAADWRIGTEHEKFGYDLKTLRPLPYDGPSGIRAMLEGLQRYGWQPYSEDGNVIALTEGGQSITLEPGGQFELSGAAVETLHETCTELNKHLAQVRQVAERLGVGFMGLGFQPKWKRSDIPVMPKGRYKIMLAYMPKKGSLGLDMMFRTCTVQVNLDYASEADMVKKFRVSMALQPVATALFANSPFTEGQPNGFQSFRSHIWTDTDPDRTGILPFVFDQGMSFERYVDHALDVPMYFIHRDGKYIDCSGQSFRDFLAGKLPAYPGHKPTMKDWADHLTTLFPEVRMKRYLELRGADGGRWGRLCALPALWVGILYDQAALDAAWDLVKDFTHAEHVALRADVPRHGLRTKFRGGTVRDLAARMMEIARAGLNARARLDAAGNNEAGFLDTMDEIVRSGKTHADRLLERFHGPWKGNIDRVFEEEAY